jgi:hypothetical protein
VVIQVDIAATPPSVTLLAPDDFAAFKVVARGPVQDAERLAHVVERVGRMSGVSHAFVDIDALVALADARARDREWRASLDGMIEYARARGWLDERGAIRAHVEWAA